MLIFFKTYLIFSFTVATGIAGGGVTVFFTQLIKGFGYSSQLSLILGMPGGLVEVISILALCYLARKTNRRMFWAIVGQLLGLFGIALMMGLARSGTTAYPVGQLIGKHF